jgi:hypothetical protein
MLGQVDWHKPRAKPNLPHVAPPAVQLAPIDIVPHSNGSDTGTTLMCLSDVTGADGRAGLRSVCCGLLVTGIVDLIADLKNANERLYQRSLGPSRTGLF